MPPVIRIGTRGSELAMWQARRVREALLARHPALAIEIIPIRSRGDDEPSQGIAELGGVGIFTREIERALQERRVDVAVHSLKDLPTEPPPGLVVAALLPRDDPRDALVAHALEDFDASDARLAISALRRGARIGTSSLRRQAELRRARPDVQIVELRGNVPTRLAKAERGDLDGVVLSSAGLDRLGLRPPGCVRLPPEIMLPAPAQGTIAIQVREPRSQVPSSQADADIHELVRAVDDARARQTTTAERALLHALQGGCRVPLGALALLDGAISPLPSAGTPPSGSVTPLVSATLSLQARLLSADGSTVLERADSGPATDPEALARRVAADLLSRGAARILAKLRGTPA